MANTHTGGSTAINPELVIYTVNNPIEQWFSRATAKQLAAFRRRVTDHYLYFLNHPDPEMGSPVEFSELVKQYRIGTPGLFLEHIIIKNKQYEVFVQVMEGEYTQGLVNPTLADYQKKISENTEKYYKEPDKTGMLMLDKGPSSV